MGGPSPSDAQRAASPTCSGFEPFTVYSSPSKPAMQSPCCAASPFGEEKENIAPAGTPPAQRWHETANFSGTSDAAAASNAHRDAKQLAGGKQTPADKTVRRQPLRNITPLLVRKVRGAATSVPALSMLKMLLQVELRSRSRHVR